MGAFQSEYENPFSDQLELKSVDFRLAKIVILVSRFSATEISRFRRSRVDIQLTGCSTLCLVAA